MTKFLMHFLIGSFQNLLKPKKSLEWIPLYFLLIFRMLFCISSGNMSSTLVSENCLYKVPKDYSFFKEYL